MPKRLTDHRIAAALLSNIEGLMAAGIEPDIEHLRYIKLAEYEDREDILPCKRTCIVCGRNVPEIYGARATCSPKCQAIKNSQN